MLVVSVLVGTAADTGDEITRSATSLWDSTMAALPRIGVAVAFIAVGWLVSRLIRMASKRAFQRRASRSFALVISKVLGWVFLTLVVLAALAITFPSIQPVDLLARHGDRSPRSLDVVPSPRPVQLGIAAQGNHRVHH